MRRRRGSLQWFSQAGASGGDGRFGRRASREGYERGGVAGRVGRSGTGMVVAWCIGGGGGGAEGCGGDVLWVLPRSYGYIGCSGISLVGLGDF